MDPKAGNEEWLRELLEMQIRELEKRLQLQIEASDTALRLQAAEYQRRLDELNNAHETARQKEADYLDRRAFESFNANLNERLTKIENRVSDQVGRDRLDEMIRQVGARINELSTRLMEVERAKSNLDGRFSMLGLILLALCTFISAIGAMIGHFWK